MQAYKTSYFYSALILPDTSSTLHMNWLDSRARQGMSCHRAVDLMLVSVISTHPSRDPPSGSLIGRLSSEIDDLQTRNESNYLLHFSPKVCFCNITTI